MALSKTALGLQVMKDRSVPLSAQQRSVLILCDGKRSKEDVARMTSAVGVTMQDLLVLSDLGLIAIDEPVAEAKASAMPVNPSGHAAATTEPAPAQRSQDTDIDFSAALNAAITLCSSLGFKGFGLNMALTGADNLQKLQQLAPEIRRAAGDTKYKPLHALMFGKAL